jgi:serine/threonine-protein kinase
MGELIVAEHLELGREFVVKLLHQRLAGDPQLVDRVRVEAQSLGRLNHPNVVSVVGFGHAPDGRPYIAMEYLRGRTLSEELSARRLTVAQSVSHACRVLSALGAAHALGIVHRDVKPDNIMLVERTEGTVLKVLDFGMARVLPGVALGAPQPLSFPTDTGVVVGTPRFVSPEAARGEEVDARADVYAVGLVLYVMLAGRGPFDHLKGTDRLLSAQRESEPDLPSKFAVEVIPPELDAAVQKALAKRPEDRFQSAAEFEHELERISELLKSPHSWAKTARFGKAARDAVEPSPLPEAPVPEAQRSSTRTAPVTPKASSGLVAVFLLVVVLTTVLVAGLATVLLRFR